MDIYRERIKPLFELSGKTDAEIERGIGVSGRKISQWNIGYTKSYRNYIPQIAEYFGVSTDYLLGKTDYPTPPGAERKPISVSEDGLSEEAKEIIRLYDLASPELRSAALAVLKSAEAVDRVPGDSAKEK